MALVFEGRLALGIVDGEAPVPAPFADQYPRLELRHAHGDHALVLGHVEALALRDATATDYLALAFAAPELKDRLAADRSACPGCAEALDRLAWAWLATLRSACRDSLALDDAATCTVDLWTRSPVAWW